VPSMVDGFKPSQRKVLFCAFKKKLKNDIKVAQFVGYISEQSAYHHGEVSLENTIINLAQNFVGSNNVNLLIPSGQFGTRLQGGKDHAASRYIYTRMAAATRAIFHPDDDKILKYLDDEGQSIEPEWYCPILPLVLVNGADGIGTGWSTSVPNYNPREIILNIQKSLRGEAMQEMFPWYKNFKGTITPNEKESGRFEIVGAIHKKNDTTVIITELPVKSWTQGYKEWLEEQMPQEGKKADDPNSNHTITDYKEYHTENTVHFEVTLSADKMKEVEKIGLEKFFKIRSSVSTSNMVLFDHENKIAKYNSALDILKDFCKLRRQIYVKRKAYLVAKLTREKEILSNKARFILMVVKGELELRKRKKADILKDLQKHGFKTMTELDAILKEGGGQATDEDLEAMKKAEADPDAEKSDYDYLLGMNLWSLSFEKVEELKAQHEIKRQELEILRKTTIESIWDNDLEALKKVLDEIDRIEEEEEQAAHDFAAGRKKKDSSRAATAAAKKGGGRPPASKASGVEDKALLKRPLAAGALAGDSVEIQKTGWGAGTALVRKHAEPQAAARGEEVPVLPPAAKSRKKAAPGAGGSAASSAAEPEPPAKEEGGASLLSRLLAKSNSPQKPGGALSGALGSDSALSSFSSFGASTDDVFGYLHTGRPTEDSSDSKPFNSLDFGLPPGLGSGGSSEADKATPAKKRLKKGA